MIWLLFFYAISAALADICFGPQIEYVGALCGSIAQCKNTANSTFYPTNLTRTGTASGADGWTGVVYSSDNTSHFIDGSNPSVLIFDDWIRTGVSTSVIDIYHYNIRISVGENNGVTISAMSGAFTRLTICSGCTPRNVRHEITVLVNEPTSAIGNPAHWLTVRVNQLATATLSVDNFPFDYAYNKSGCGTHCPIYVTSNAIATSIHHKSAVFTSPVNDDYLNMMNWYRNSYQQICSKPVCPTIDGTFVNYTQALETIYSEVASVPETLELIYQTENNISAKVDAISAENEVFNSSLTSVLDKLVEATTKIDGLTAHISNLTRSLASVMDVTQNNQLRINCVTNNRCGGWQWWDGAVCVDNSCFGIWYRSRAVCQGNGACVKYNTCHCFDGFSGNMCQHK